MNLQDTAANITLTGLVKLAGVTAPKAVQLQQQQFMPINSGRRELSPEEQRNVEQAEGRLLPHLFPSWADLPEARSASPVLPAIGGGLVGGGVGAALGYNVGTALINDPNNPTGSVPWALGGAAAGGILGAILSAKQRMSENRTISETKRRFPEGATIRDVDSDPLHQQQMAQRMQSSSGMSNGLLLASLLNN